MVAVLDGMGGLPHAREAAATAGTAVLDTWDKGITSPAQLLVVANAALLETHGANVVGVTASIAVYDNTGSLRVAWIGDVRAAVRETVGWAPVTMDHTRLAEFTAPHLPTILDAQNHSELARKITKSLGEKPLRSSDIDYCCLSEVGRVLLCSDGYWSDERLASQGIDIPETEPLWRPSDDATVVTVEKLETCSSGAGDLLVAHV